MRHDQSRTIVSVAALVVARWSRVLLPVEREPSFHTTRAEEMFSASYLSMADTGNVSITYDVAPDGQHFAMIDRGAAGDLAGELYVITDWSTELERLVPTDSGR